MLQAGNDAIAAAVGSLPPPVIVVEQHRNFGDILHATIVIRQLRAVLSDRSVVFAVSEQFTDALRYFDVIALGPHQLAALPRLSPYPADGPYRVSWVVAARTLPGVERAIGVGVHPWGWRGGSIVDGVLANADVGPLVVPRRPCLPVSPDDVVSARALLVRWGIAPSSYVALEYRSFSAEPLPVAWWAAFVRELGIPVVAIAHGDAPQLVGAIDARGTSLREAKSLIADAACFVGCGSGLSVLAAAIGCETRVVENCPEEISMAAIGYRAPGDRHRLCRTRSPSELVRAVREIMGSSRGRATPASSSRRSRTSVTLATSPRRGETRPTRSKRLRATRPRRSG